MFYSARAGFGDLVGAHFHYLQVGSPSNAARMAFHEHFRF